MDYFDSRVLLDEGHLYCAPTNCTSCCLGPETFELPILMIGEKSVIYEVYLRHPP